MKSLGERVKELVAKDITTISTPINQDDITDLLQDAIRDFISRAIVMQSPNLLSMLTTTKVDTGTGIALDNGFVLGVVRNEALGSTTLNPATQIDATLRGRAADVNSLYYQSHFNPVFYIHQGKVHTLPTPQSATDYAEVTYVSSQSAIDGTQYGTIDITDFPRTFIPLIIYYAGAMASLMYAADVHNNFPANPTFEGMVPQFSGTLPTFTETFTDILPSMPVMEDFLPTTLAAPVAPQENEMVRRGALPSLTEIPGVPVTQVQKLEIPEDILNGIDLPSQPVFIPPSTGFDLARVDVQITEEDMDMVEKEYERIDKQFDNFDKNLENSKQQYEEQIAIFNKEFDRRDKNNERSIQARIAVFKENVGKYSADIARHDQELKIYTTKLQTFATAMAKYKGDIDRYTAEVQAYSARIAQWQGEVGRVEKKGMQKIQIFGQEIAKYQAALAKYNSGIQLHQIGLTAYQAELAAYQAELKKYDSHVSKYQLDISKYSADINKLASEYQWYTQRYQLLYNQYMSGFSQSGPAQQQAEA